MTGDAGPGRPDTTRPTLAAQAARLAERPLISAPRRGRLWQGWSARHVVAMVLFAPVFIWVFRGAAQNPPWQDAPWTVAVVALAALATLVAVSYLPVSGTARQDAASVGASPCASVAIVHVVAAAMLLSLIPALPMAGLALAIESFALYQRASGACGTG